MCPNEVVSCSHELTSLTASAARLAGLRSDLQQQRAVLWKKNEWKVKGLLTGPSMVSAIHPESPLAAVALQDSVIVKVHQTAR